MIVHASVLMVLVATTTALHHFNACNHLEFLGAHVRPKQCPHQDPKGPVSPPLHTLEHSTMHKTLYCIKTQTCKQEYALALDE